MSESSPSLVTPSFSPDGRQVAFAWDGEKEDNWNIYVKLVGETHALQLTNDPAPEYSPAWSPDGKRIAFVRDKPGAPGIWLVSPLGGEEQKLADLEVGGYDGGQMAWSPDGRWLAVGRAWAEKTGGIVLVPADGGEARRMTTREAPGFDIDPRFSPDGRLLAYASCISEWSCDVFVQQLASDYGPRGNPRRITSQGFLISGLAWSPDGTDLVYGGSWSWGLSYRLWRVPSTGGQPPERLDLAGVGATGPAVAPAGHRLAFSRTTENFDVWRYQLGGVPEPFLKSSVVDAVAQFSPDGSRIVFASGRAGNVSDLWTVDADGLY